MLDRDVQVHLPNADPKQPHAAPSRLREHRSDLPDLTPLAGNGNPRRIDDGLPHVRATAAARHAGCELDGRIAVDRDQTSVRLLTGLNVDRLRVARKLGAAGPRPASESLGTHGKQPRAGSQGTGPDLEPTPARQRDLVSLHDGSREDVVDGRR